VIEGPDRRVPGSVQALGYRDYRLYWTTSVRLTAIGIGSVALFTLGLAVVPTFALGVVAMGGVGLAFMVTMPTLTSSLQSLCDDAYRGRVMSLWMMLFGLAAPTSILVQGRIASAIGIRWVLAITAFAVAVYLASQLIRGRLRHLDAAG